MVVPAVTLRKRLVPLPVDELKWGEEVQKENRWKEECCRDGMVCRKWNGLLYCSCCKVQKILEGI